MLLDKRVPSRQQRDLSDCGPACLSALLAYYGASYSVLALRFLAQTDKHGTSLLSLSKAAQRLGYESHGVCGSLESLPNIATPFIAHVRIGGALEHYVVVQGSKASGVYVMDPSLGRTVKWSVAEFIENWTGNALTINPKPDTQLVPEYAAESNWSRSRTILHEGWRYLAVCIALAVVVAAVRYVPVLAIRFLLDAALREHVEALLILVVGITCFSVLEVGLDYWRQLVLTDLGLTIQGKLVESFVAHLFRLPQSIVASFRQGELAARFGDIARVRALLTSDLSQAFVEVLTAVVGFAILASLSGLLAIITAIVSVAVCGIVVLSAAETSRRSRESAERLADLSAGAVEMFGAIRTIRQLAADDVAVAHVVTRFDKAAKRTWAAAQWGTRIASMVAFLARMAFVAALAVAGQALVHQTQSVGSVVGALFVSSYLLTSVIAVGRRLQQMLDARIVLERLGEITEFPPEEIRPDQACPFDVSPSGFVFRDVVFRYGAREPVINGFSLACQRGTITALLGINGSGKSTLFDLAQGLYPTERGAIFANGIPVHELSRGSRAKLIGVVTQDNPVFACSLAANITFGDASPDLTRAAQAASRAGLSAFVAAHPQGLNMLMGERGVSVSGGQRQMLGLARALYRDPEFLLLDEPSSSLDSSALTALRALLLALKKHKKTILIISHQPWVLAIADAACVLENGKARLVPRDRLAEQCITEVPNACDDDIAKPQLSFSSERP